MRPKDVTIDSFAGYSEDFNKKDPNFKVCDHVRFSKYKNIFAKGYTPITGVKKSLLLKKIKKYCSLDLCN